MQMFEIRIPVIFEREVIFINPPTPLSPFDTPLTTVSSDLGSIFFYFDEWDLIGDNIVGDPPSGFSSVFIHFIPRDLPDDIQKLFMQGDDRTAKALFYDNNTPEIISLRNMVTIVNPNETEEEFSERRKAQETIKNREDEIRSESEACCAFVFSQTEVATYFHKLGQFIIKTTRQFLEILRTKYNQYLIPDRPLLNWGTGYWLLAEGTLQDGGEQDSSNTVSPIIKPVSGYHFLPEDQIKEISPAFLRELLKKNEHPNSYNLPSIEAKSWSEISKHITEDTKPTISEVLIATAFGECEPYSGNPRLGLIEAVVALEIEVKTLMKLSLARYQISSSAVERIVRETPLADLTSVWIRREIPTDQASISQDIFSKCAVAVHERNELIHHSRRNIAAQRAQEHIQVIAQLVEVIRQIRQERFGNDVD